MKVRLTHSSVRFRLTQSEVKLLGSEGVLEETIPFSPQTLRVVLRSTGTPMPMSTFNGTELVTELSEAEVRAWAQSEQVGLSGESAGIRILVEKDFKCLHPADPGENLDTFPNPAGR